jgi:hypothetical protein
MQGTVFNVAERFRSLKPKWEQYLYSLYPQHFDGGMVGAIHIGSNDDAAAGSIGGFKLRGHSIQQGAVYLETPEKQFPVRILADADLRRTTTTTKIADSVALYANERVSKLVAQGKTVQEAQAIVSDSIPKVGYFDGKTGLYVVEPVVRKINDSMLSGMATPYWNVSQIQKVYKQPYLTGYADRLVSAMGVPNIWADIIQIFTASYEGAARVSNVAHASQQFNTSIGPKRRVGTMLSELINIVMDYESPGPDEQMIAGQGAWLVGTTVGDMDVFCRLMRKILINTLIYFGHEESGFDGLTQIAIRDDCYDQYPDDRPPASYFWDHDGATGGTPVNDTVGADLLQMLNHIIADKLEELHWLPTSVKINCGSTLYKVLRYSMLSKVYNQNNPLSIINTAFESQNSIVGTLVTKSFSGVRGQFELCPDPMLDPDTPFNPTDEDLMFITFPSFQTEFAVDNVLSDLIMMPNPISDMLLPSAPGYRDGVVRTGVSRIGSLLCPIRKTVHVITGMGTNSRYTPPAIEVPDEGGTSGGGSSGGEGT